MKYIEACFLNGKLCVWLLPLLLLIIIIIVIIIIIWQNKRLYAQSKN